MRKIKIVYKPKAAHMQKSVCVLQKFYNMFVYKASQFKMTFYQNVISIFIS